LVIFEQTPIAGAFMIDIERRTDERGFFARTWCRDELAGAGIPFEVAQASLSHNRYAGTLRGLHYAAPPAREGKLVRCERGAVFDVIVDLRPGSSSYLRPFSVVLEGERHNALYVPPGVAHGFQTLVDHSDVAYLMSEAYRPELAAGVRFDDPAFRIRWPRPVRAIAERDRSYPDFDALRHASRHGCATVA
jgi:dTDP-4-dehydrorhamnose 3,5-epimerase